MHETALEVAGNRERATTTIVPASMEAVVKGVRAPGAQFVEVDVPAIGPDDVRIKVLAASICGTDLHLYGWDEWAQGRVHPPLVFGHEFAGEVVAVGTHVVRTPIGAYVAAESHISCGDCYECRHGLQHICRDV